MRCVYPIFIVAAIGCAELASNMDTGPLTLAQAKAKYGEPDSEVRMRGRSKFAPFPALLRPTDRYTQLYYKDYEGQHMHVYCVSPKVYERAKGVNPGEGKLYVLEVISYPKGSPIPQTTGHSN